MLSFTQVNLHKATQATVLVGRGLEGSAQSVVLATEPYTFSNKVTGIPNRAKLVHVRNKDAPRACIITTPDVQITAMESWCNKDCAVALAKIGGRQTVIVSLYLDIKLEVQPPWLDRLMQMIDRNCLLYTSPSPRDRQKSRMPSSA